MVAIRQAEKPVNFTVAAVSYLLKTLEKEQASVFRLSVRDSGCNGLAYKIELLPQANETDIQYLVQSGLKVAIQAEAVKYIAGTEVDYAVYENSLGLKKLVFNNPNVSGECGCGESFNVGKTENDE